MQETPVWFLGQGRSPGDRIGYQLQYSWASLVAQTVKNPPAMWEIWAGKIPWRRAWQPTPVFLPGESPWTEDPGGLQSRVTKESDTNKHRHRETFKIAKGLKEPESGLAPKSKSCSTSWGTASWVLTGWNSLFLPSHPSLASLQDNDSSFGDRGGMLGKQKWKG